MALYKRVLRVANELVSSLPSNRKYIRQVSQGLNSNGKQPFLVDTLALVRGLEAHGLPPKQAEAITSAITGVLRDSLEIVSQSFVSKAEMQKARTFPRL
ncbi:protein FMP32, mitochondrial-like [Senna tora]|uniref:Protein FMP32, mitochondrial-like n=1 Tax=Senna tora TaxID=362788 RepID=A0A834XBE2_9FABA|nr:protein FMP32, mitochondrial-like [Senna tora]